MADLSIFDKEVQAKVRRSFSRRSNVPELADSDNDVPDKHRPGHTKRRIAPTPPDDYPIPKLNDMRIEPQHHLHVRALSKKETTQTPDEYWENRVRQLHQLEISRLEDRAKAMLEDVGEDSDVSCDIGQSEPDQKGDMKGPEYKDTYQGAKYKNILQQSMRQG